MAELQLTWFEDRFKERKSKRVITLFFTCVTMTLAERFEGLSIVHYSVVTILCTKILYIILKFGIET